MTKKIDRRHFLRTAGIVTAGTAAITLAPPLATEAFARSSRKVWGWTGRGSVSIGSRNSTIGKTTLWYRPRYYRWNVSGGGKRHKLPSSFNMIKKIIDDNTLAASPMQVVEFVDPRRDGELLWFAVDGQKPQESAFVRGWWDTRRDRLEDKVEIISDLSNCTCYSTFALGRYGEMPFVKGYSLEKRDDGRRGRKHKYGENAEGLLKIKKQLKGTLTKEGSHIFPQDNRIEYVRVPHEKNAVYARFTVLSDDGRRVQNSMRLDKGKITSKSFFLNENIPPIEIKNFPIWKLTKNPSDEVLDELAKKAFRSREWKAYLGEKEDSTSLCAQKKCLKKRDTFEKKIIKQIAIFLWATSSAVKRDYFNPKRCVNFTEPKGRRLLAKEGRMMRQRTQAAQATKM
ncbi:MAG TPA: hypothetical protein DD400_02390, partial [Rhodospirillaceae bacterium]|nr:hypothetical protein [Rhodospirillaceae bacterium]